MEPISVLHEWIDDPVLDWLSPAALRLARRVPEMHPPLDGLLSDPMQRALAGLVAPPSIDSDGDVGLRVLAALAHVDGGGSLAPDAARGLESACRGDAEWWVPSARIHVLASEDREREARMALSDQSLPYVFPGELHPMMVDALAVGDRVLTALHVDWMRKLTGWLADALVADLRMCGLWFWPQLRYLSERKLLRPLQKVQGLRRGRPGSQGLAAAYLYRVGGDWRPAATKLEGADRLILALALASDRPG